VNFKLNNLAITVLESSYLKKAYAGLISTVLESISGAKTE
jgi:hypothetical protein